MRRLTSTSTLPCRGSTQHRVGPERAAKLALRTPTRDQISPSRVKRAERKLRSALRTRSGNVALTGRHQPTRQRPPRGAAPKPNANRAATRPTPL